MENKNLGNLTELQCITRFYELGYFVSIPYGDSNKYDMILDYNGKLYKLQCKHAKEFYDDSRNLLYLKLKTSWQSGYTKNSQYHTNKYDKKDIDFFVTHFEGKNYLIPVGECSTKKTLWVSNPRNNQNNNICFLQDYEGMEVLKGL